MSNQPQPKLKIILIGNYEPAGQQSMLRFASLLARLLASAGHNVQILRPRGLFGKLLSPSSTAGKWLGYIDQFIIFPTTLRARVQDADIVHICDHSNAMYIPWVKHRPHVITCNDLLAIRSAIGMVHENQTGFSGRVLQAWITHQLRDVRVVACISKQTQRELLETIQPKAEILRVIYMSQQYSYHPMTTEETVPYESALGVNGVPYFMHVGGNQWYKNRLGALQLFRALSQFPEYNQHHFVMVGKPLLNDLRDYITMNQLDERVHELVDITDEELSVIYSQAEALLFPSLAEGFGWPPIEAQSCGCPVVISDIAPLNEVTPKDAAIFIAPQDIPGSAEIIRAGLKKRDLLIQAGFANAARYSEATMLGEYLAIYGETISLFETGI